MNYLEAFGGKAGSIATLTWALLILSIAVVVIITALTLAAVLRRRSPRRATEADREPLAREESGLSWITIGVAISTVALLGGMAWNAYTMAAINRPPHDPALTIRVIGHQWWWQFRYKSDDPSQIFDTANEAHIPVGQTVRFEVETADVIHSFWIPALGDKIDLIPGQTNETWLEAGQPGVYRGQCSEYCGRQHAHMAITVVADAPKDFEAWRAAQLRPAKPQAGTLASAQTLFVARCGACHTVRGAGAGGALGPDLTHLMSRRDIAANTLPNTIANLSGWIADPQTIKPGAKMPVLELSAPELATIRQYLETLE
ncbi:cytochrome c oxidase subunit II [Methylocystis sp. MJC1]|jgi:cytochrome c oxidase subunit 2|nr:cytochrome c oxidase subunit II [Methylocystis sp. MJC1]MBU6528306.1 cytochrome c oxidase subunit II [Methylocystis sp. MJC1]